MTVTRFDYDRTKFQFNRDDDDGVDEKSSSEASVWEVRFVVEAKGFGRAQVRNMIGFIVDVCRGSIVEESNNNKDNDGDPNWIWKMDTDKLAKQINAAPACGLCLEHVVY